MTSGIRRVFWAISMAALSELTNASGSGVRYGNDGDKSGTKRLTALVLSILFVTAGVTFFLCCAYPKQCGQLMNACRGRKAEEQPKKKEAELAAPQAADDVESKPSAPPAPVAGDSAAA